MEPVLAWSLYKASHRLATANIIDDFNDNFSKVGEQLAAPIDPGCALIVDSALSLHTVTEFDLLYYVTSLRGGSAPGNDCITATFVKQHFTLLSKPQLDVTNGSIITGDFSEELKSRKSHPYT